MSPKPIRPVYKKKRFGHTGRNQGLTEGQPCENKGT